MRSMWKRASCRQSWCRIWENPARGLYFEHPQRQRDEAVRTGAIGATAMIYATRALGLGSTSMIGFDAEAVPCQFGLAEDEAGHAVVRGGGASRELAAKAARPVADVLEFA